MTNLTINILFSTSGNYVLHIQHRANVIIKNFQFVFHSTKDGGMQMLTLHQVRGNTKTHLMMVTVVAKTYHINSVTNEMHFERVQTKPVANSSLN
jgi:hypothetical protein